MERKVIKNKIILHPLGSLPCFPYSHPRFRTQLMYSLRNIASI